MYEFAKNNLGCKKPQPPNNPMPDLYVITLLLRAGAIASYLVKNINECELWAVEGHGNALHHTSQAIAQHNVLWATTSAQPPTHWPPSLNATSTPYWIFHFKLIIVPKDASSRRSLAGEGSIYRKLCFPFLQLTENDFDGFCVKDNGWSLKITIKSA